MAEPEANSTRSAIQVRRARRSDVGALLPLVGGPPAARARALRRIQKSLESDLYVLEREGQLLAAVHVVYRRSLSLGGLRAIIDCLARLDGEPWERSSPELGILIATALQRATRRGCLGVDAPVRDATLGAELQARGFSAEGETLHLTCPPRPATSTNSADCVADTQTLQLATGQVGRGMP
jgi:hypothetical protein